MIQVRDTIGKGGKYLNTDIEKILKAQSAFSGKAVVIDISPASIGNSAATINAAIGGAEGKFVQDITLTLKDLDGNTLEAFTGSYGPIGVLTVATNSASGSVAFDADTIEVINSVNKPIFTNGVATVSIEYTGTFVAADTVTLTVTEADMAEANGGDAQTVVDTIIA